ncbi:hypothetical protein XELAEV_18001512mg [Xenopus laevis]|nr:hypothetical protein XELAEV_18001512mg [Xenopus laevis]
MAENAREALMAALRRLSSSRFKEFKEKLSTWDIPLEYERIPQNQLQKAGRTGAAILITSFYGNEYGLSKAFHLIDTICLSQECKSITAKKHGRIFQGDIFRRKAIPNQQLEYGSKSDYLSPDKKPSEDSDWEEMMSLCPGPMTKVLKDNKDKSRVLHHRGTPASIPSVIPATSSGSKTQGKRPEGDMSDKQNRLDTYQGHHFPHNNQRSLSRAGFYYVGPGDRVRCFSCGGELENWKYWADPLTRHQRSFPDCPYVKGQVKREKFQVSPVSITEGETLTQVSPSYSSIFGEKDKSLGRMSDQYNRLETYRGHSNNFPHNNPLSLSRAGFYYVGPGDRVQCFSCGGELENCEFRDDPLTRHQLSFPDCPFVKGQVNREKFQVSSVPITEGETLTQVSPSCSSNLGEKDKSLGTMSDEHNRLETYGGYSCRFPYSNPQSLSRAGFYYVGPGDRVRCFSCGGELENWEYWDVPFTRHQLSFPGCPYVRGLVTRKHYQVRPGLLAGDSMTQVHPSSSNILWEEKLLSDMSDEYKRLETYRGYSNNFQKNNPLSLAWAGFYYVGPGDRVRCFSCGGELENCEFREDPLTRHQLSFPDCLYVLHKDHAMKDLKAYLQSQKFQTTAFSSSVTDYDNSEPVKRHFGKCTDPPGKISLAPSLAQKNSFTW